MKMLVFLFLQFAGAPDPVPTMSLEVDGKQFGEFANLVQGKQTPPIVTLEQGWIDAGFLELWWPELDADDLTPGEHKRESSQCEERRVDVRQTLALGRPGRERAWALMGACPVSYDVEQSPGDDGRLVLRTLTLRVTSVAAAM